MKGRKYINILATCVAGVLFLLYYLFTFHITVSLFSTVILGILFALAVKWICEASDFCEYLLIIFLSFSCLYIYFFIIYVLFPAYVQGDITLIGSVVYTLVVIVVYALLCLVCIFILVWVDEYSNPKSKFLKVLMRIVDVLVLIMLLIAQFAVVQTFFSKNCSATDIEYIDSFLPEFMKEFGYFLIRG